MVQPAAERWLYSGNVWMKGAAGPRQGQSCHHPSNDGECTVEPKFLNVERQPQNRKARLDLSTIPGLYPNSPPFLLTLDRSHTKPQLSVATLLKNLSGRGGHFSPDIDLIGRTRVIRKSHLNPSPILTTLPDWSRRFFMFLFETESLWQFLFTPLQNNLPM